MDQASKQVNDYIEKEKKRKQIYSVTLEQDLWYDAQQLAMKKHDGNFSKCVATALEEYLDREIAKGLAIVNYR